MIIVPYSQYSSQRPACTVNCKIFKNIELYLWRKLFIFLINIIQYLSLLFTLVSNYLIYLFCKCTPAFHVANNDNEDRQIAYKKKIYRKNKNSFQKIASEIFIAAYTASALSYTSGPNLCNLYFVFRNLRSIEYLCLLMSQQ